MKQSQTSDMFWNFMFSLIVIGLIPLRLPHCPGLQAVEEVASEANFFKTSFSLEK